MNAIPQNWKKIIIIIVVNETAAPQHNDITKSINILTFRDFYSETVQEAKFKATSIKYSEKVSAPQGESGWKQVYMLQRKSTVEPKMRSFQFKIIHNVLFLNAKFFKMHIVDTPLCGFCKEENEIPIHLFSHCV